MSPQETVSVATQIVEQLERGDVSRVWDRLAEIVRAAVPLDSLRRWIPGLDEWIGSPRKITDASAPDATSARVLLAGAQGVLSVTVAFDEEHRVTGLKLAPWIIDGIRNVVIGSPPGTWNEEAERVEGEPRLLGAFYAELLGQKIIRDDWIKVGDDPAIYPHLAFGDGWSEARPPRWRDPEYPHQLHLDFFVPDLDSAEQLVLNRGATRLQDAARYRIYADPMGHPFCLYPDDRTFARLGRVVFDCLDTGVVAAFYAELLDMPERVEDSADRVVIAQRDGSFPMLGFQHVSNYVPPRWNDPAYPAQMHLDLQFNDHAAAKRLAAQLGAVELPPPRGSCPVYADPAGHPFCLCSNAGGDEPLVVDLFKS